MECLDLYISLHFEIFVREYGESKNSVIFPAFLKNEGNFAITCRAYALVSRAIDRVLWKSGKIKHFKSVISRAKVSLLLIDTLSL